MKTRLVMLFAIVLFVALPATAASADPEFTDPDPADFTDGQGNFDQDGYVAALNHEGDGCTANGGSDTCSIQLCEGSDVVALFDGDQVFDAPGTSSPFVFSFPLPPDTPAGTYTVSVGCDGDFLDFTVEVLADGTVVGASLPRTGSNTGTLVGVGAAMIVLGAAAVVGARQRRRVTSAA